MPPLQLLRLQQGKKDVIMFSGGPHKEVTGEIYQIPDPNS
jgi:hypothetical protein